MSTSIIAWSLGCIAITFCYLLVTHLRYIRHSRKLGCEEPPRYAHKDRIFGLDLFFKIVKAVKQDNFLPASFALYEEYGKTFQTIAMGKRVLYTIDPENVKSILVTDFAKWGVAPTRLGALDPFFGKGILTVDGALWHRSRKMLMPSLERQATSDLAAIEAFAGNVVASIPTDGSTTDMQPLFSSKFVAVTTQFLFGSDHSGLPQSVTAMDLTKDFDNALTGGYLRIALDSLRFLAYTPKWLAACKRARCFADAYVDQALKLRQNLKAGATSQGVSRNVLLHSLAQQSDDRDQMRNDILQAFSASRETTANLMTKVIFVASRNPEIWQKLRSEALSVVSVDASPIYEQLKHLPYMRKVINEVLRLYPLLPNNSRTALVDTVLPTGGGPTGKSPIFTPAGTKVNLSFYTMHRYPEFWGQDANQVRVDRWDSTSDTFYKYLPFGIGPRHCVGRDKALTEASFVLVKLLQRFSRVESRDSREWRGHIAITAENLYGCHVAFFD